MQIYDITGDGKELLILTVKQARENWIKGHHVGDGVRNLVPDNAGKKYKQGPFSFDVSINAD